ncbi:MULTISPECIES: DDE-type integrase/transposase/recombinase [unclassified Mesorhizobium]|uniref:DDE-type integrase/transposase/recombinase n=2 Tax=unclassified Mesorhizobium TaxID=325217 RepID=UPI000416A3ED|nr:MULTISPECIES: DDE-type integrase/transposase/recombinase [unclassified Mesorhizobium]
MKVDHSTVHRWVAHFSPQLLERFNRRKRVVGSKWHWTRRTSRSAAMYLYRAIDILGDTVEFFFSENRNLVAAQRFLRKVLTRHGRPERIVIDGSQTNYEAILSCDAESRLRQRSRRPLKPIRSAIAGISTIGSNRITGVSSRIRSMLGFKSHANDVVILSGIEMIHMMGQRQARYAYKSVDRCFDLLAA